MRSEAVGAALRRGDACEARERAEELQRRAVRAINAGEVPAAFQEELQSTVNDLADRVDCVPEPPAVVPPTPVEPAPPAEPHEDGEHDEEQEQDENRGEGRGKGAKKGGKDK